MAGSSSKHLLPSLQNTMYWKWLFYQSDDNDDVTPRAGDVTKIRKRCAAALRHHGRHRRKQRVTSRSSSPSRESRDHPVLLPGLQMRKLVPLPKTESLPVSSRLKMTSRHAANDVMSDEEHTDRKLKDGGGRKLLAQLHDCDMTSSHRDVMNDVSNWAREVNKSAVKPTCRAMEFKLVLKNDNNLSTVKSYIEPQPLAVYKSCCDVTVIPECCSRRMSQIRRRSLQISMTSDRASTNNDDVSSCSEADDERSEFSVTSLRTPGVTSLQVGGVTSLPATGASSDHVRQSQSLPAATTTTSVSRRKPRRCNFRVFPFPFPLLKAITDVDSNAAMSREATQLNPWPVVPDIQTTDEQQNKVQEAWPERRVDVIDDVSCEESGQERSETRQSKNSNKRLEQQHAGGQGQGEGEIQGERETGAQMELLGGHQLSVSSQQQQQQPSVTADSSLTSVQQRSVPVKNSSSPVVHGQLSVSETESGRTARRHVVTSSHQSDVSKKKKKRQKWHNTDTNRDTGRDTDTDRQTDNHTNNQPQQQQHREEPSCDKVSNAASLSHRGSNDELYSGEDMEFVIVRDADSHSPTQTHSPGGATRLQSHRRSNYNSDVTQSVSGREDLSETETTNSMLHRSMDSTATNSVRDLRAAQREIQASRRREEVERRRKEREEQRQLERAEEIKRELMIRELEEERRRREEQHRLERERREEERRRKEALELELERLTAEKAEREKRQKEEYLKRMELLKIQQAEEEKLKLEMMERLRLAGEEAKQQEMLRLAQMDDAERREYERQKLEQEKQAQRLAQLERLRREEEERRLAEEAEKLSRQLSEQEELLKRRLEFNRQLQLESRGLQLTQDITRAFAFSYIQLINSLTDKHNRHTTKTPDKTKQPKLPNTTR